jgi:hypothetical protein
MKLKLQDVTTVGRLEYAVAKVLELRHDMTASDALNAVNLVRSFL